VRKGVTGFIKGRETSIKFAPRSLECIWFNWKPEGNFFTHVHSLGQVEGKLERGRTESHWLFDRSVGSL